jgi:hypothetical protein
LRFTATGVIIRGVNPDAKGLLKGPLSLAAIPDGTSNTLLGGENHVPQIGLYYVD